MCCRGLGHSPGAPDGKFLHKQLCGQETPPQSLPFDIHWQLLLRCKSHRPRQHFNLLPTIKVSAGITVPDTVNLPVPELFSFPAGCCWTPSAAAATPPPCSREDRHLGPHQSLVSHWLSPSPEEMRQVFHSDWVIHYCRGFKWKATFPDPDFLMPLPNLFPYFWL